MLACGPIVPKTAMQASDKGCRGRKVRLVIGHLFYKSYEVSGQPLIAALYSQWRLQLKAKGRRGLCPERQAIFLLVNTSWGASARPPLHNANDAPKPPLFVAADVKSGVFGELQPRKRALLHLKLLSSLAEESV